MSARLPIAYQYTYEHVARAAGISPVSMASLSKEFDIGDLRDVAALVQARVLRDVRPMTDEEVESEPWFDRIDFWLLRYPMFELFRCPKYGCDTVVVGRSFCDRHGSIQSVRLNQKSGYFEIRAKRWVSLHRVIMGEPLGMEVHHIDHNKWNNHSSNLEVLTHDEHMTKHSMFGFG